MVKEGKRLIEGVITKVTEISNALPAGTNLLGEVKVKDSGGTTIDPATKGQLPSALTGSGNVKVAVVEDTVGLLAPATTPVIYNVTMTSADTEYSQALPANTKKFLVHTRDGTAFRLAFVTGKVATPTEPFLTIPTDQSYYEDLIKPSSLTLYLGCASASKVVEIVAWS